LRPLLGVGGQIQQFGWRMAFAEDVVRGQGLADADVPDGWGQ
jgi:hypothetical protein